MKIILQLCVAMMAKMMSSCVLFARFDSVYFWVCDVAKLGLGAGHGDNMRYFILSTFYNKCSKRRLGWGVDMMNIYQMYCCAVFAEHTKYYSVLCTSMYKGNMTHNYRKYCCVAFKYFCQYCAPVCIRGEDDEHLSNEKEPAPRATWLYPSPSYSPLRECTPYDLLV